MLNYNDVKKFLINHHVLKSLDETDFKEMLQDFETKFLITDDLDSKKVAELKELCKARGLKTSATKGVLINQLRQVYAIDKKTGKCPSVCPPSKSLDSDQVCDDFGCKLKLIEESSDESECDETSSEVGGRPAEGGNSAGPRIGTGRSASIPSTGPSGETDKPGTGGGRPAEGGNSAGSSASSSSEDHFIPEQADLLDRPGPSKMKSKPKAKSIKNDIESNTDLESKTAKAKTEEKPKLSEDSFKILKNSLPDKIIPCLIKSKNGKYYYDKETKFVFDDKLVIGILDEEEAIHKLTKRDKNKAISMGFKV